MKRSIFLTLFYLFVVVFSKAQTNVFPSTGNVGIGTISPSLRLHVVDSDNVNSGTILLGSLTYGATIAKKSLTSGDLEINSFHAGNGAIRFQSNGVEKVIFSAIGNVGIGTSTPSDKLQIEGGDVGVSLAGSIRSRLNLYTTNQYGWQIEVANTDGNQYGGDLGFTESGVAGGRLVLKKGGNVGIGLLNPSEKLSVNGNVRAKKVIVSQTGWPDYVFDPSYKLRPLSELSAFIQQYKHLPDLPSAKEVEEKGISVGDNQALLLKKIEELTLYIIQLDESNKKLVTEVALLKQKKQTNEK